MKIGLLYSDNNPKLALGEKIDAAITAYKKRYDFPPSECHINPIHLKDFNTSKVNGVKIVPDDQIRSHDFWIGYKEHGLG